ncbi:hypothetical protein ACWDCC_23130 [Streptomyces sp. NPDC001102]
MRRMLLPVVALAVGVATACGTSGTGGTATPSASATTTVSAPAPTVTRTVVVTPSTRPARGPGAVVEAYYAAINAHDYRTAWRLGGSNFSPDYGSFVAAFAGTAHDRLRVLRVSGSAVTVSLEATQTSGVVKLYSGTYYVSGGVITGARMRQTGTSSSPAPGGFVHPGAWCSHVGATGRTDRGTPMVCSRRPGDDQPRWRQR